MYNNVLRPCTARTRRCAVNHNPPHLSSISSHIGRMWHDISGILLVLQIFPLSRRRVEKASHVLLEVQLHQISTYLVKRPIAFSHPCAPRAACSSLSITTNTSMAYSLVDSVPSLQGLLENLEDRPLNLTCTGIPPLQCGTAIPPDNTDANSPVLEGPDS